MTGFLSIALALIFGLLFTRVTNKFKLPDVTAYLVAGVLIGPYCLGRLGVPGLGFNSFDDLSKIAFISDAALGFIAFAIGSEFKLSQLKKTGKQAIIIGILQAVITTIVVDVALVAVSVATKGKISIPAAITLGAIASATAPAATLMVVRQFKAKGKVTDVLLPVVAIDDAVGLALFAVSFGVARAMAGGSLDVYSIVCNPIIEIVASLLLGAVAGAVLTQLERMFHSNRNRTALIIGFILMTVGISMLKIHTGPVEISFSSLLVCMMMGTVFCNLCPLADDLMERSDKWSAPLLALFFVISGSDLELGVFADIIVVGIGVAYILSRCAGKFFGAYISSVLSKADPVVKKYLGITLFPQAGVALGMCVTASVLPGDGPMIRNIILFAVLVYELVGPMLTKIALTKSGDIVAQSEEILRRREKKLEEAAGKK
ncbi:MAG: cation:proton antiporter [Clostridia bacterium]|nr:cation:proton antiporter [Clostridia bacterium]